MRSYVACENLCQGVCECSGTLSYFMIPAIRGYAPREPYGVCHTCGSDLVEVGDDGVREARARGYLHTDQDPCSCGKSSADCQATDEAAARKAQP